MGSIPYCQSITDYSCLNIEMRKMFYEINENCPKYCYIMEYTGKRTFMLETDNNTKYEKKWYYIFSSKEVQVQEEYLLCDITGFVGTVSLYSNGCIFKVHPFECTLHCTQTGVFSRMKLHPYEYNLIVLV